MWDELWIERDTPGDEIARAVSKAHGCDHAHVEVIDGIATPASGSARVTVHRTRGGGEFAMRIQLSGQEPEDRRVFCAKLASALSCKVLGDDGNVNPFTFMLYEPGNATRVSVDIQHIEEHEPVVLGPYDARDDEGNPTKPIRRYPEPSEHRTTRGGQIANIVLEYMVEGLPRPPLVPWALEVTDAYKQLEKLLGTLAYRKASADELANVKAWSRTLAVAFPNQESAGWFVVELLEAAGIVLREPWDPDAPAIQIQR
jgi:hypothetical protein